MTLIIVGIGGFLLFYKSAATMIQLLEFVTIIAFLNLRAIQSDGIPITHRPPNWMIGLAYIGLFALVAFAIYYVIEL